MAKITRDARQSAAWKRLKAAQERLKTLEVKAGIREALDRPGGVPLWSLREHVFLVPDLDLRRQIMAECRECERAAAEERAAEDQTKRLRELIKNYGWRRRREVMIASCTFALALIFIGHIALGNPWDIAGATVGILFGVAWMFNAQESIDRSVEKWRQELVESVKNEREWRDEKPLFSDSEINSGNSDAAS
jgi:hypothetical protein